MNVLNKRAKTWIDEFEGRELLVSYGIGHNSVSCSKEEALDEIRFMLERGADIELLLGSPQLMSRGPSVHRIVEGEYFYQIWIHNEGRIFVAEDDKFMLELIEEAKA